MPQRAPSLDEDPADETSHRGADVEMGTGELVLAEPENADDDDDSENPRTAVAAAAASAEMPFADAPAGDPRTSFLSFLSSPMVTLGVGGGGGEPETILSVHQGLLAQSPYLRSRCAEFSAIEGQQQQQLQQHHSQQQPPQQPRRILLPDADIDAVGSALEYLYTGEYFPRKLPAQRALEPDPTMPGGVDEEGELLLRHARVYTLADGWGLPALKTLASSKIHCVNSTVRGEITYARYVYAHTSPDDTAIRAPVANFWATRSHNLRSDAEAEFRALCLEHPQFGYDVLTRVLDEKVKREKMEKMHPTPSQSGASARKRARHSNI